MRTSTSSQTWPPGKGEGRGSGRTWRRCSTRSTVALYVIDCAQKAADEQTVTSAAPPPPPPIVRNTHCFPPPAPSLPPPQTQTLLTRSRFARWAGPAPQPDERRSIKIVRHIKKTKNPEAVPSPLVLAAPFLSVVGGDPRFPPISPVNPFSRFNPPDLCIFLFFFPLDRDRGGCNSGEPVVVGWRRGL